MVTPQIVNIRYKVSAQSTTLNGYLSNIFNLKESGSGIYDSLKVMKTKVSGPSSENFVDRFRPITRNTRSISLDMSCIWPVALYLKLKGAIKLVLLSLAG